MKYFIIIVAVFVLLFIPTSVAFGSWHWSSDVTICGDKICKEIQQDTKIPDWVENIFIWYDQDKISQLEFDNALKYLNKNEIIQLQQTENLKEETTFRIEIPTEQEKLQLPECNDKFFTTSPVDINKINSITPLGNLGPPGHTLPTQHPHIHLGEHDTNYSYSLYAPADVFITSVAWQENISQDPIDYVIYFALCQDIIGYYNHVKVLSDDVTQIIENVECESFSSKSSDSCTKVLLHKVPEGTKLGAVGLNQGNFDFGLIDQRDRLDFINPDRYPVRDQYLYCAFDYYPDSTKQQFYDLINRVDGTCGHVMYDIPNTLKGNWFHETAQLENVVDWNVHLAFVDHYEDPSIQVVSVAGIFTDPSLFKFIPQNSGQINREFSQVTADGHIYCYQGANVIRNFEIVPLGKVLLQMTGDESLQVEYQSDNCTGDEIFLDPAVYHR